MRSLACFLACLLLSIATSCAVFAQSEAQLRALEAQIGALLEAQRFAEALPRLEEYGRTIEQMHGELDPRFGDALVAKGKIHYRVGQLAAANGVLRRAVDVYMRSRPVIDADLATALSTHALVKRGLSEHQEAEDLHKRALAMRRAIFPAGHNDILTSISHLADLYSALSRPAEAIPLLLEHANAVRRQAGAASADHTATLHMLGVAYRQNRQLGEALAAFESALAFRSADPAADSLDIAATLIDIAKLHVDQGGLELAGGFADRAREQLGRPTRRPPQELASAHASLAMVLGSLERQAEAIELLQRALAVQEAAGPRDEVELARTLHALALTYEKQGRLSEAEATIRRSIDLQRRAQPSGHPDRARSLLVLAQIARKLGRLSEAERALRQALEVQQQIFQADHADMAATLNLFGDLAQEQGRIADAEQHFKRSVEIREKAHPGAHPDLADSLQNLAFVYMMLGRAEEAERLLQQAIEQLQLLSPNGSLGLATALENLAALYGTREGSAGLERSRDLRERALAMMEHVLPPGHTRIIKHHIASAQTSLRQMRVAEAERHARLALGMSEPRLAQAHPLTAASLDFLAASLMLQGRFAEAEPLALRLRSIDDAVLPEVHPDRAAGLGNLSVIAMARQDWLGALGLAQEASRALAKRPSGRSLHRRRGGSPERFLSDGLSRVHAAAAFRAGHDSAEVAGEAFEIAQRSIRPEAGAALAQMAARHVRAGSALSEIVRIWQDGEQAWLSADRRLGEAIARGDRGRADAIRDELRVLDGRVEQLERRMASQFPEYAELAQPRPLSVAETQAELRDDEALVLLLDAAEMAPLPEETLVWVITKSHARWVRSDLGTTALRREVAALRCGLDRAAWDGEGASRCAEILERTSTQAPAEGKPLPFDPDRAHALYRGLLGGVEDLIGGKHLLVVASGALEQLPFQVLVTEPAHGSGDMRKIAWLARRHAVTVLPSVSSLKALRRLDGEGTAALPMIGFGNPLLDGDQLDPQHGPGMRQLAQLARSRAACRPPAAVHAGRSRAARRSYSPIPQTNGLVDLPLLKRQLPLPETADQLCAVAEDVGADAAEIRLGARASEREVKALSASGRLSQFRVLHFATHGMLAGQLSSPREPGLVLSPPMAATHDDDGYLSASEIAGLRLNADWVILSACNTAGPAGSGGAEALSGLARVFLYAGARSLLVSHWEVDSRSMVKLITGAVRGVSGEPSLGRSEALRRAMLALIDDGDEHEAHPAYWAAFVIIGEGAPARRDGARPRRAS